MKKPKKEDFGWHEQEAFDDEPSGWIFEGGEEAYYKALNLWEESREFSQRRVTLKFAPRFEQLLRTGAKWHTFRALSTEGGIKAFSEYNKDDHKPYFVKIEIASLRRPKIIGSVEITEVRKMSLRPDRDAVKIYIDDNWLGQAEALFALCDGFPINPLQDLRNFLEKIYGPAPLIEGKQQWVGPLFVWESINIFDWSKRMKRRGSFRDYGIS